MGALQVAGAANACQVCAPPSVAPKQGSHLHAQPLSTLAHCLSPIPATDDPPTSYATITCISLRQEGEWRGDAWLGRRCCKGVGMVEKDEEPVPTPLGKDMSRYEHY